MSETPNHGYNIPGVGEEDWHEPLNENFEKHDRDIEIRDTESNLGEYDPKEGAKFLAMDTGMVYVGTGTEWTEAMALGVFDDGDVVVHTEAGSGDLSIQGNIEVSGTKHFVETVQTDEGPREIVYTASESPTPRTEITGVARLKAGRAEITLPEHFTWVTSAEEPLAVQTTPYSSDTSGLAVVERSLERVVVEAVDGRGEYEFAYTVTGTRRGFEQQVVVRTPEPVRQQTSSTDPEPTSTDD